MIRLNKYLSHLGVVSRREADKLIEQGKVYINNEKAYIGMEVDENDYKLDIKVLGKIINTKYEPLLIAYNKRTGVICTESNKEKGVRIVDEIKKFNFNKRLFTIGRLDKDTSGLILLTNDGDYAKEMSDKSKKHEKEYIVKVDKEYDNIFLSKMSKGVFLKDLNKYTQKAKLKRISNDTFSIIIVEGLNRQIRRMCKELGYKVLELKRIRIDDILLNDLKENEYRKIEKFNTSFK
ncbi:MAG: pseudouridine synthase [Eubacteriales bacterium]|nr:pseudouridine synthase [Eubacteriales bacterium]